MGRLVIDDGLITLLSKHARGSPMYHHPSHGFLYTPFFYPLVLAFVAGTKTSLLGRVGEILMAPWVAGMWGWVNRFWVTIPLIMRGIH